MQSSPEGGAAVRPRTGCDLQAVGDVADAVRDFGTRYLDRVYTRAEQAECRRVPASLAARWAAKEAVIKVLGTGDGVDPRSIEVTRNPEGRASVSLTGRAAELAEAAHLGPIDVSLSHTGDLALAVATALQRPIPHPHSRTTR
jgi:holo-[acyl-carrier protein] synthase